VKGEKVLVEAKSGQYLWDAQIIYVSKKEVSDVEPHVTLIDGYRVQYKDWSANYTEWVSPKRVVEPNENNRLLQVSHMPRCNAVRCNAIECIILRQSLLCFLQHRLSHH
jgi:hypothetical protein